MDGAGSASSLSTLMLMKRSANLCIALVIASSVILAQKSKTPPVKAEEMRDHQLRVFREQVLSRVLDNIKKWTMRACECQRETSS